MVITDKVLAEHRRKPTKPAQEAGTGTPVVLSQIRRDSEYVEPGGHRRKPTKPAQEAGTGTPVVLSQIRRDSGYVEPGGHRRKPTKPAQEAGTGTPVVLSQIRRDSGYVEPGASAESGTRRRTAPIAGPRSVRSERAITRATKITPDVIRQRIEGIIERTGIPVPTIRIRQEAHEIVVPDIKVETPAPVAKPLVCEAKLVKRPDMVKIDTDFDFTFSVKNCGDAPGDFETVVVISKTGAASMEYCLDDREYGGPSPVARLYESKKSELPAPGSIREHVDHAYGVTPPHILCGPGGTYPTFKTIMWGVAPGETKQSTVTCRIGKEYTGRANINVRAWARLISPPEHGGDVSRMAPGTGSYSARSGGE